MSSPTPQVIATVTGDGFETCYVSFKPVIASDGPLSTTPTVTSSDTNRLTISEVAVTFAGTINGTAYAAGEILTFRATNQSIGGTVAVQIVYQTPKRRETLRVAVLQRNYAI